MMTRMASRIDLPSLPANIREALQEPKLNPGAAPERIAEAAAALDVTFPQDYIAFMVATNGAEFYLGESCVIVYPVEELTEWNQAEDGFPSYFKVFGSNGGSEKFAFDTRARPHPIVVVPHYKPSDEDAIAQGTSLHEFLGRVLRDEAFNEQ